MKRLKFFGKKVLNIADLLVGFKWTGDTSILLNCKSYSYVRGLTAIVNSKPLILQPGETYMFKPENYFLTYGFNEYLVECRDLKTGNVIDPDDNLVSYHISLPNLWRRNIILN